jgi:hypothetical protein
MSVVSLPEALPLSILTLSSVIAADSPPTRIPTRVAEEAEVLQQNVTRILTRDTLIRHSRLRPSRAASAAERATGPRLPVREVVSEFSFGPMHSSPSHDLMEFRQVLSDGVPMRSADSALRVLSEGIRKGDDRARKRMLEQFACNGLVDIATDCALVPLVFTTRGQKQIEFSPSGRCYIGADPAIAFLWKLKSAEGSLTEFHGRESVHRPLQGTVWVRASDGVPLRVNAWMEYADQDDNRIRDDASVDCVMSQHRFLTPASVVHHHLVNGAIVTENLYRYEPFRFFSAKSTISFGSPK